MTRPAPTVPEGTPPPAPLAYPLSAGATYGRGDDYEPLAWFDALAGERESVTWATYLEGR